MSNLSLKVLSDEELRKIQGSTIEILENVGVWIEHEEARQLFKKAGALVDNGAQIVKITPELLQKAINKCSPVVELYSRYGDPPMQIGNGSIYFGTQGFPVNMLDWRNGEYRKAVKNDLADLVIETDFRSGKVKVRWILGKGQRDP